MAVIPTKPICQLDVVPLDGGNLLGVAVYLHGLGEPPVRGETTARVDDKSWRWYAVVAQASVEPPKDALTLGGEVLAHPWIQIEVEKINAGYLSLGSLVREVPVDCVDVEIQVLARCIPLLSPSCGFGRVGKGGRLNLSIRNDGT